MTMAELREAAKAAVGYMIHREGCDEELRQERWWDCSCGAGMASLRLQHALRPADPDAREMAETERKAVP